MDAFLSDIVSSNTFAETLMEGGRLTPKPFGHRDYEATSNKLFVKLGDPLIEVNNDHYPTASTRKTLPELSLKNLRKLASCN
ncbi:MAG: hypothetical protein ACETWQ_20685 [Phycisphaerae bacterium]